MATHVATLAEVHVTEHLRVCDGIGVPRKDDTLLDARDDGVLSTDIGHDFDGCDGAFVVRSCLHDFAEAPAVEFAAQLHKFSGLILSQLN